MSIEHDLLQKALIQQGSIPRNAIVSIKKIGEGSWHEAFAVTLLDHQKYVIRIRKSNPNGVISELEKKRISLDYEAVKRYYHLANLCKQGICPANYEYFVGNEISFTIETYMGTSLVLEQITIHSAYKFGVYLGEFYKSMHALSHRAQGFGKICDFNEVLVGEFQDDLGAFMASDNYKSIMHLEGIVSSKLKLNLDLELTKELVKDGINVRQMRGYSCAIVNSNPSHENTTVSENGSLGIIDPIPRIDDGLKYAALFLFCYSHYFYSLSEAPRFKKFNFQRHQDKLASISRGFIEGYAGINNALKASVQAEIVLALVNEISRCLDLLTGKMSEREEYLFGSRSIINVRLKYFIDVIHNRSFLLC